MGGRSGRVLSLIVVGLVGCDGAQPRTVEVEKPPCRLTVSDAVTGERLYEMKNYVNAEGLLSRVERPERTVNWTWGKYVERVGTPYRREIDHGSDGQVDEIWRRDITPEMGEGGQPLLRVQRRVERLTAGQPRLIYNEFCDWPVSANGLVGWYTEPTLCETDGVLAKDGQQIKVEADGLHDQRTVLLIEEGRVLYTRSQRDVNTGHLATTQTEVLQDDPTGPWQRRWTLDGRRVSGQIIEPADGELDVIMIWTDWARVEPGDPQVVKRIDLDADGRDDRVLQVQVLVPDQHLKMAWFDVSGPSPVELSRWSWWPLSRFEESTFELDGRPGSPPDGQVDVVGRCEQVGGPPHRGPPPRRLAWLDIDGDGEPEQVVRQGRQDREGFEFFWRGEADGLTQHRPWADEITSLGFWRWEAPLSGLLEEGGDCVDPMSLPDFETVHASDGQLDVEVEEAVSVEGSVRTVRSMRAVDSGGDGQIDYRCVSTQEREEEAETDRRVFNIGWCEVDLDGDGLFDRRAEGRSLYGRWHEITIRDLHTSEVITSGVVSQLDGGVGFWSAEISDLGEPTWPDDIRATWWGMASRGWVSWMNGARTSSFSFFAPPEGALDAPRPARIEWDGACRAVVDEMDPIAP